MKTKSKINRKDPDYIPKCGGRIFYNKDGNREAAVAWDGDKYDCECEKKDCRHIRSIKRQRKKWLKKIADNN